MTSTRRAAALVATALLAQSAPAQSARDVRPAAHAWLVGSLEVWQTPRWGEVVEVMYERAHLGRTPQQIESRFGVQRALRSGARVSSGFTYILASPYDDFARGFREYRPWAQLALDQRAGVVSLSHRYRIEARFIDRPNSPGISETLRARYQLRGTVPLTRGARPLYAALSEEPFVGFGPHAQLNLLEQNRAIVGIGSRWSSRARMELSYMNQLFLRANGTQVENNHTLQLSVAFTRPAPTR